MAIVRRPRERDAVGCERQQRLACAAELTEALEDQPYRLLETQVGIEAEAMVPVPEVADGHADPELAPLGLRARRIEHPRAQDAELELADAALHAEQEPVVRPTRVIHAVEVDHPGLDETAEFQQVMPVTAIAGETGRVEAQHCADLAGTERRHQATEARTRHHPARGTALGRKNYLFVGSASGGKAAAIAYTLIESAKLNGVDPEAWLAHTLACIPDYKINKIEELLPWQHRP